MKEEKYSGGISSMKLLLRHTSTYSSGWSLQLIERMKYFRLANVEDFIPGIYVNQIRLLNQKISNRNSYSWES